MREKEIRVWFRRGSLKKEDFFEDIGLAGKMLRSKEIGWDDNTWINRAQCRVPYNAGNSLTS